MPSTFRVDTGTICPFPRIYPATYNASKAPPQVEDCTLTYAQRLNTEFRAIQLFAIIIPAVSFAMLLHQLVLLKRRQNKLSRTTSLWYNPSFEFFLCALVYNILLVLQSVDLFNFLGIYPAELYCLLEESMATAFLSMAVLLVDFWVRCAKFKSRVGLPKAEKIGFITLIAFNFVGWIIVGVADPAHYKVYEIIKSFDGMFILCLFLYKGYMSARTLTQALSISSDEVKHANPQINEQAVKVLRKRFLQFSFVIVLAAVLLFVNGVVVLINAIETGVWHWKIDFFEQLDPLQVVLRVLFLFGSIMSLVFFKAPERNAEAKKGKKVGEIVDEAGNDTGSKLNLITGGSKLVSSPRPQDSVVKNLKI